MRAIAVACALIASAASAKEFRWDVPDLIRYSEVPEIVQSNGYPVRLAAAVSKRRPEQLAQYYMDKMQGAGLYVPQDREQQQATIYPQLTGLDVDNLVSYTVIFQPNADRTTTVILGITDLERRVPEPGDFAPIFPGATRVFRTNLESMRTIGFVTRADAGEVDRFYRELLEGAGFTEAEPMTFTRDAERIRVVTRNDGSGEAHVVVNQTFTGAEGTIVSGSSTVAPVLRPARR